MICKCGHELRVHVNKQYACIGRVGNHYCSCGKFIKKE